MKDLKAYKAWMIRAARELSPNEFKVFVVWFDDAATFCAGASRLHMLMPFIRRAHIARALKGLEKKNFLQRSGRFRPNEHGKPTPELVLGVLGNIPFDDSKCTDDDQIMYQSASDNVPAMVHVPRETKNNREEQSNFSSLQDAQSPLGSGQRKEQRAQENYSVGSLVEKLKYIIGNDRRPSRDPAFPPNYRQAEKL